MERYANVPRHLLSAFRDFKEASVDIRYEAQPGTPRKARFFFEVEGQRFLGKFGGGYGVAQAEFLMGGPKPTYSITGEMGSAAIRVFATVFTAINHLAEEFKISEFSFASNEEKRSRTYQKMCRFFSKLFPEWRIEEVDVEAKIGLPPGVGYMFTFSRDKYKDYWKDLSNYEKDLR